MYQIWLRKASGEYVVLEPHLEPENAIYWLSRVRTLMVDGKDILWADLHRVSE